ncbi:hypothetical protein BKA64DRAFT_720310 [Cadophora sp. MPI-SDFR-AT-0126]|nr:hypothetical protein BKA64DRAFT_720310 [Leotiomycetes sp. MPI-SDFR-AT-0126]
MVDASRPAIIGAIHKTVNDINHLLRRQDDDQNKSELLQLLRDCTNIKATILTSLSKMNVSKAKPGHSELTRKNKRLALKAEKSQVNTGVWKGGIEKARLYSKSLPRMTASAKDRAKGMYKACAPTVAQGLMHMLGSQSQIPSATVRKLDIIPVYTPRRSPPQPPPPPKAERSKAWEAKNMVKGKVIMSECATPSPISAITRNDLLSSQRKNSANYSLSSNPSSSKSDRPMKASTLPISCAGMRQCV